MHRRDRGRDGRRADDERRRDRDRDRGQDRRAEWRGSDDRRGSASRAQPDDGRWAAREQHYDAQADPTKSPAAALAVRRGGPLIRYKRWANSAKRRLINQYAGGASVLVDLGCGRGGDIGKWHEARVGQVLALDLSSAQLDEAAMRERQQRPRAGRPAARIVWRQRSMVQPDLAADLRPQLSQMGANSGADAVAAMFALQYAFGSEAGADHLLSQVSALLRPRGIFFGTAPDADAIIAHLRTRGDGVESTLGPPDAPFTLRLKLIGEAARAAAGATASAPADSGAAVSANYLGSAKFGAELIFSLEDTVTAGSDADGATCSEYLLHKDELLRLGARHGLEPIEVEQMLPRPAAAHHGDRRGGPELSESEAAVAGLYFTFALRKVGGVVG